MFRSRYLKGIGAVSALILVIYSIRDSGIQPRLGREFSGQDITGMYKSLTNRGKYQSADHDGVKEPLYAHISNERELLFINDSVQSPASAGEFTDPCTMYTYYSEVKTEYTPPEKRVVDQETIDTWKKWWSAAGWKPRVLSEDDAKSHPQYYELREKFMALPTVNPKEYELACFMRYVALAAVGGGWMSDFDMLPFTIPTCLKPLYGGNFTGHQRFVPSLVSASSSEFTRLANRLANVDYKKNPKLYTIGNNSHVSDMHVMSELWREGAYHAKMTVVGVNEVFNETPVCETHAKREDMPDGFPGKPWAIHYSHQAITRLRDASGNKTEIWPGSKWNPGRLAAHTDLMRAEFMKDSIEYIFKLCNIGGNT